MSIWNFTQRRPCNYVVFHHIPKCGGVSLVATFSRWFSIVGDYEDSFRSPASLDPLAPYRQLPVPMSALNPSILLCGHYNRPGAFLHQRYPGILHSKDSFVFTYLRDPLEVAISLYYYKAARGELPRDKTLRQFLHDQSNYIAQQIPCDAYNYQEVMARYDYIGLLDNVHEHTEELLRLLGHRLFLDDSIMARRTRFLIETRPVEFTRRYNEAARDDQSKGLTESDLAAFRERNAVDYMIYEYVDRQRRGETISIDRQSAPPISNAGAAALVMLMSM